MASSTQRRMTAAEFALLPETRMPTELINGVVIAPPTPRYTHQRALMNCAMLVVRIAPEGETCIGPNDVYFSSFAPLANSNIVQYR